MEEACEKHPGGVSHDTASTLKQLADSIMQCCKIDPVQRLQPTQALKHAFVQQVYTGTGEVAKGPETSPKSFASASTTDTPQPASSASTSDAVKKTETSETAEDTEGKVEVVEAVQPSLPSVEGPQAASVPEQAPKPKEPEKPRFLMLNPENSIKFRGHTASLHMTNNSRTWVAFKFKTTNPDLYLVKPTSGVLARGARQELQLQLQSKNVQVINSTHRFLVQSMEVASGGPVPREKWTQVSKSAVQEHHLGAELVKQPQVAGKTNHGSGLKLRNF